MVYPDVKVLSAKHGVYPIVRKETVGFVMDISISVDRRKTTTQIFIDELPINGYRRFWYYDANQMILRIGEQDRLGNFVSNNIPTYDNLLKTINDTCSKWIDDWFAKFVGDENLEVLDL
jgi:hypothetical protein